MKQSNYSLLPFDAMIIAYSVIALLALAINNARQPYWAGIGFYVFAIATAIIIAKKVDPTKSRLQTAIRYLYPAVLFTFFYKVTAGQIFLLHQSFHDVQLSGFEQRVLGFEPSVFADGHLLNVWVNELLSFCYVCYYPLIPVFLITLFVKKKYTTLVNSVSAMCLMFFSAYALFTLYPIEGPRWLYASQYAHTIDGPLFRQLVIFFQKTSVHGGAMPSSHFGVALIILLYTFKQSKKWGYILLPLVIGLGLGAVWGRYHYISDIVVGGIIGLIAYALIQRYWKVSVTS